MNILFLYTGNSCRSILAEATFNHLAPTGFYATSAGSQPTGEVHPRALALLAKEGINTEGVSSKSWNDVPTPDIVITVCANAAGEVCPAYLLGDGEVLRAHWGVADPAYVTGSEAEINQAFEQAYGVLRQRIEAFFALPLTELAQDKPALQQALNAIAQLS